MGRSQNPGLARFTTGAVDQTNEHHKLTMIKESQLELRSEASNIGGSPDPREGIRWSDVALLGIAASFSPLDMMSNNILAIAHPERVLALIAVAWAASVAVALGLVRRGVRRTTAVFSTFFVISMVMAGGGVLRLLGQPIGWLAILGLVGSITLLIARSDKHQILRPIMVVISAFLVAGPLLSFVDGLGGVGLNIANAPQASGLALTSTPDVFLVVLDGYVGLETLARDFGFEEPAIVDALEDRGFEVPRSAWSSFPSTRASVPSLLDMSYPLEPGDGITPATDLHLSEVIGGNNSLNTILESAGYESVMVESGWSGSFCGGQVDRCVTAPFLDEMMFSVLERTLAGPTVLESFGYSFTVGAQRTMTWLAENAPQLSVDDVPSFVFTHIMAPHPPFFLDQQCQTVYSDSMSGVSFARASDDMASRRGAYLAQASCLNDFMVDLSDRLDPDDVVVFVADHGSDGRNQLIRDPASWTDEDLVERYNVFLAVRDGKGCSVGSPVVLPNIFRRVLSCLSDEKLPDLAPRMLKYAASSFKGRPSPILEVSREDLSALLDS